MSVVILGTEHVRWKAIAAVAQSCKKLQEGGGTYEGCATFSGNVRTFEMLPNECTCTVGESLTQILRSGGKCDIYGGGGGHGRQTNQSAKPDHYLL